jgi:hypothetical protein
MGVKSAMTLLSIKDSFAVYFMPTDAG